MNKKEARTVLESQITDLRGKSLSELELLIGNQDVEKVQGDSGSIYYVERDALWDDRKNRHLRVMVSVDDGGMRAFHPLSDDFIVGPDGRFIGESSDRRDRDANGSSTDQGWWQSILDFFTGGS